MVRPTQAEFRKAIRGRKVFVHVQGTDAFYVGITHREAWDLHSYLSGRVAVDLATGRKTGRKIAFVEVAR